MKCCLVHTRAGGCVLRMLKHGQLLALVQYNCPGPTPLIRHLPAKQWLMHQQARFREIAVAGPKLGLTVIKKPRNVRQRLDDTETRLDGVDSRLRGHETRLKCLEAPYRIVLRGFTAVREFLAIFDGGDFKGAKTAFIPSFIQELRDKSGPEVTQLIEELDTHLCERQGWVLLGCVPYGWDDGRVP